MSPTAFAVLERPETANYDSTSLTDFLSSKVRAFSRSVEFTVTHPDWVEYLAVADRDESRNLPYSKWSDHWIRNTRYSVGAIDWLAESYDLTVANDSIDYLFEDALPESVPLEWIAELELLRSSEDQDLTLPWNEDPPLGHAGS